MRQKIRRNTVKIPRTVKDVGPKPSAMVSRVYDRWIAFVPGSSEIRMNILSGRHFMFFQVQKGKGMFVKHANVRTYCDYRRPGESTQFSGKVRSNYEIWTLNAKKIVVVARTP
jgi:hypothetical protein